MTSGTELHTQFHKLWTVAVGQAGYYKDAWIQLERLIDASNMVINNSNMVIGMELKSNDSVSHPKHYTSHPSGVECITIVTHHNFNTGNAIKYLWRCGIKNNNPEINDTAVEDLRKAIQYIQFEIERLES